MARAITASGSMMMIGNREGSALETDIARSAFDVSLMSDVKTEKQIRLRGNNRPPAGSCQLLH